MSPQHPRLRSFRLLVVLAVLSLLISCCDKPATSANVTGSVGAQGGAIVVAGTSINGRTTNLNMSIRVVDLYIPKGSQRGAALDVWTGTPSSGGKKLATVGYGQVSELFAPEIPDPDGRGQRGVHVAYAVNFYPVGKTADADMLMIERQISSPKQKLTLVAIPGSPATNSMGLQVFVDDLGTTPDGGGFHAESVPTPPAGRAVMLLGALAMQYRGSDPTKWDVLTPSNPAGKCLPFIQIEDGTIQYPSRVTTKAIGGTATLPYLVKAGVPVRINKLEHSQSVLAGCTNPPVVAPTDTKLRARERAYGFVYGPQLLSARLLVVPVV